MMNKSLEQVGIDVSSKKFDIDIIMTGKPKSLRDRLQVILRALVELEREVGTVEKTRLLEKLLSDHEIQFQEAEKLLTQLLREGTIYSPKEGFLRKT